eukprot:scaffold3106_cov81-Skeletonema_marinoi.AAC.3
MAKASLLLSVCLLVASSSASSFSSKPNPTSKLRLQQVLVVHRHGDRSPITPLKDEDFWQSQLPQPHVLEGIAKGTTLVRPPEGNPIHGAHGRGPFGQLTMMGVLQMASLGERLREELQDTLFTDEKSLHPSRIRIMSTDFPRTIQSVQALLTGLFEGAQLDAPAIEIDVRRTNSYLIPDPQPRQSPTQLVLESHLAKRPHLVEKEKELNELAHKVTDALQDHLGEGAMGVSFGIGEEKSQDDDDIDGTKIKKKPLAWAKLAEILTCLHSRDLLPPTLSKEDVEQVNKHVAWRWFENLSHPVLAKSAMWKFANKMVEDMEHKVECAKREDESTGEEHIEEPLLCIYSAHDSTLIGLLCVLQLEQPESWPEYGSYLKAELIQEEKDGDSKEVLQHWVRFSLNGQVLRSTWTNEPADMVPLSKLSEMIHSEHDIYCEHTGSKLFTWKNGALVHTKSQ